MGCQIYTSNHGIYYSTGAWLASYMSRPWFNDHTDTDGEYYQFQVSNHALTQADYCVPWTFEAFIKWADQCGVYYDQKITRDDFNTARQFIRDAARSGEHAHISY